MEIDIVAPFLLCHEGARPFPAVAGVRCRTGRGCSRASSTSVGAVLALEQAECQARSPWARCRPRRDHRPHTTSSRKRWDNERVSALTPILSSPGWELLESLQAKQATTPIPLPELGSALRASGLDAELVVAVLTQLALRQAARAKFGPFAYHMVFTRDGLEQATRLVVAARHAQRFKDCGATRVADLGCGIGSDAMAIAGLGMNVLAVDIDPDTAGAVAANLRAFEGSEVRLCDVTDLDMDELAAEGVDAVFADPV